MSRVAILLVGAAALAIAAEPRASQVPAVASSFSGLSGQIVSYEVAPGDTLRGLSARFGVDVETLAATSGLRADARLRVGQRLTVDNRHIVPPLADDIVISIPQRLLYLRLAGQPLRVWPVAVGRPGWPTPRGPFAIASRVRHPTWHVPASIQAEMRRAGKPVLEVVAPGPANPLGDHFMALSMPGIGMHGTNAPSSIYGFTTHGCIRLAPEHAAHLFELVAIGMRGRIEYRPLLLTEEAGRVFFEVHRDAYRQGGAGLADLRALSAALALDDRIDWPRALETLRAQEGIARDITWMPQGD